MIASTDNIPSTIVLLYEVPMLEGVDSLLYTVAGGAYTDENVVERAPTHMPAYHARV